MVDRQFAEDDFAALYDVLNARRPGDDFDFYLALVMSAPSVLDVGCGTGTLLHLARAAGHTGRLCGLDPAAGMLHQARKHPGIEWVEGDAASASRWQGEFELIVMSGPAFQVFVTDNELHAALAAIRSALAPDGRFAFETRNPLVRAWERWTPEHPIDAIDPATGAPIRLTHRVETPVTGDLVTFTSTFTSPALEHPQTSTSTLRFLDPDGLSAFLSAAGLEIERQYGDWDSSPLTATSREIITIARHAV